jgi:hypothetical protein
MLGLLACAVAVHDAMPAYLPKLGAAPFRFRSPARGLSMLASFPPLKMTEDSGTLDQITNATGAAAAAAAEHVSFSSEPLGPPPPVETISTPTNAPTTSPVKIDAGPVVTPQMLLQFFAPNPGATNLAPQVIAPGAFQLPQPAGSSATYNVK